MDRSLLWVTGASLVGLAMMMAAAGLSQPPRVGLTALAGHVGSTVITQARIVELDIHEAGWTRLLLAGDNHSVEATLTAPPYASPGDVVDATGVVQRKGTRIALRIEHPDDVIVRIPWYDQHEPLRRLAQRPWELRDARVVTSGAYVRSGVSQFFEDDGHRVRAFGPALLPFESGVRLRVDGVVEYDEATFAFRLRVEDARLA